MKQRKQKNAMFPKKSGDKKPFPPRNKKVLWSFSMNMGKLLMGLVVFMVLVSLIMGNHTPTTKIALSDLVAQMNAGTVKSIVIKGNHVIVTNFDATTSETTKESEASLSETLKNYGVTSETIAAVPVTLKNESGAGYWLLTLLPIVLPIVIVGVFFYMLSRQMNSGGGMKAMTFGQSKARVSNPDDDKQITFDDVAGNREAKYELTDIVDFLRNPDKYFKIGAKIPKGILLTGEPGTGKTLLARAVAGEANAPFFHLSGSEFVEMFVGVGASRVRDLFDQAKKASPAIIFIDEIDAVGRARGVGIGGGNDEREQTLNQILVEMDGFEPTEKVIILAATNRADVLDPALLRPGRFDRTVYLDMPDRRDREAILNIHATEKPLGPDVDLAMVATRTPGFSGADLQSLMNEAAITTAKNGGSEIMQNTLLSSIEKVMIGPERKSYLHNDRERKIAAYHEAGHAIISSVLEHADPVHKITIVPRGSAAGYMLHAPLEDRKLETRAQYLDDIAVTLGGYAVEKMIFGDVTTGPSSDLQSATKLAHNMVTKWGMSDALGPIAFKGSDGTNKREYSQDVERKIDEEISLIIKGGLVRAEETLAMYREALEVIANKLLEVETLEQDEYNKIIRSFGIIPKTKEVI